MIRLIADGLMGKEIAGLIGKTEPTTDTYRTRLLKKTGTKNAPHLISWAYRNGVLTVN